MVIIAIMLIDLSNIMLRYFLTQNHNNYIISFKSYVRPLLEYASTLWHPYSCGLNNIEFTKRVFSKCNFPYHNYEYRYHFLKLNTLSQRRLIGDLTMVYK